MDKLSVYDIDHIIRYLDIRDTITFSEIVGVDLTIRNISKQRDIIVIEQIFKDRHLLKPKQLEKALRLAIHTNKLNCEDLICFMANLYPNKPKLTHTLLFDLLKLYDTSKVDWNLISVHFNIKQK